jgi:hypothetical protein
MTRASARASALALAVAAIAASRGGGKPDNTATVLLEMTADQTVTVAAGPPGTWAAPCAFVVPWDPEKDTAGPVSLVCLDEGTAAPSIRSLDGLGDDLRGGLAALRAADGSVDLLVGAAGEVRVFSLAKRDAAPVAKSGLRDVRLGPTSLADRPDLDGDGTADLVQGLSTGVAAWRLTSSGFALLHDVALPPSARFSRDSVKVSGTAILPSHDASGVRFTEVDERPGNRWRVFRVALGGDGSACPAFVEPGGAWRAKSAAVVPGDHSIAPRLVALAQPSDRLALLKESRLVIAPLACRTSGKGAEPEFFYETDFPNMSSPVLRVDDLTGDGTLDIVAEGDKGLFPPDVQIAVWRGIGDGHFEKKPLTLIQKFKGLEGADFTRDIDGDGSIDLTFAGKQGFGYCRGVAPRNDEVPLDCSAPVVLAVPKDHVAQRAEGSLRAGSRRVVLVTTNVTRNDKQSRTLVALELPSRAR